MEKTYYLNECASGFIYVSAKPMDSNFYSTPAILRCIPSKSKKLTPKGVFVGAICITIKGEVLEIVKVKNRKGYNRNYITEGKKTNLSAEQKWDKMSANERETFFIIQGFHANFIKNNTGKFFGNLPIGVKTALVSYKVPENKQSNKSEMRKAGASLKLTLKTSAKKEDKKPIIKKNEIIPNDIWLKKYHEKVKEQISKLPPKERVKKMGRYVLEQDITSILYKNSIDCSDGMIIRFEKIQDVIGLLADILTKTKK